MNHLPKPRHAIFALLFLGLLLPARPLRAADEWRPIAPADLAMTSDPRAPGARALILYRQEEFNDRDHYQTYYVRIKILTTAGLDTADVEIPYDREFMSIYRIKGRTIHANGTIVPFDGQSRDKTLYKEDRLKLLVRSFTLPQAEVGSIIEYKYTVGWLDFLDMGASWNVQTDLPQREAEFSFYHGKFRTDNETLGLANNVMWLVHLPAGAPTPKFEPSNISLRLTDIPGFDDEPHSPPREQLLYSVRFFYVNQYQSNSDYWEATGAHWNHLLDNFMGSVDDIAPAAHKIAALLDTPQERAAKLYAEVQRFENTSYGRTRTAAELKEQKQPNSAADVIRLRRGDANELNMTFVALARSEGLEMYTVVAGSREFWFFNQSVPDGSQLQHDLALWRINGHDVYLDPGSADCPFGFVDWRFTGVRALRQTADRKVAFTTTAPPELARNVRQFGGDLALDAAGNLTGTLTVQLLGQEALTRRQAALRQDASERDKDWVADIQALLPVGAELSDPVTDHWDDPAQDLSLRLKLNLPAFATPAGNGLLLAPAIFEARATQPFPRPDRVNSVYYPYPYTQIDDVRVHLPAGWRAGAPSAPVRLAPAFASYTMDRANEPDAIHLHRRMEMGVVLLEVKDYPALRALFAGALQSDQEPVLLSPPAAAGGKLQ